MIQHIRKDIMSTSVLFLLALSGLLFLSLVAVPLMLNHLGIFTPPQKQDALLSGYDTGAFADVQVQAKAYVVYDVISGQVIAGKDMYTVYPLASLTKVMTAMTALHIASSTTPIKVQKKSIEGSYDLGLKEKQVWSLGELLKYTLVFSSNDGAQLIADTLLGRENFISKMNSYARELGVVMVFTQPAGLDENGKIGGLGSAYDMARLMALAQRAIPTILEPTTHTRARVVSSLGPIGGVPNTNQHIDDFIGVMASKTGFTDSAGGNLAITVDASLGRPVTIVVLGSTRDARFSDAFTLYQALIKSLR